VALAILWIEAVCTGADGRAHYEIMAPDLSEEEKIALVDLLKRTVEADHYPLSLRVLEGAARIPAAATPPSVISGPGLDFTRGDAFWPPLLAVAHRPVVEGRTGGPKGGDHG
jgi:hypothetical protein